GNLPSADRLVHARALLQLGRAEQARTVAEKVVANSAGRDRVRALLLLGEAHRALGEAGPAADAWREALVGTDDAAVRAEATYRLGMVDYLAGRVEEAQRQFEQAYQIAADAGDRREQAWSLLHLAWAATTLGDFTAAEDALGR